METDLWSCQKKKSATRFYKITIGHINQFSNLKKSSLLYEFPIFSIDRIIIIDLMKLI